MLATTITIALLALGTMLILQQPVYGKNPRGKRLEKVEQSPNYRDGKFQNQHPTEVMREGASYWQITKDMLNKPETNEPSAPIPSIETDLNKLNDSLPTIVWFGHSSYLMRVNGLTILVDPVLSGNASPVSFFGKAFEGSNVYNVEDMPFIDICIITHDHYDHLDYRTIKDLHPKVKIFYTALGVGQHLEDWGVQPDKVVELDWWDTHTRPDSVSITAVPARHFSGRGIVRAKTLWAGFALNVKGTNILAAGDSGYDTHYKEIGERLGPFDIAMLECGQYGKDWPAIHMTPEETYKAALEVKTNVLMPVHWAKFSLAFHPWTESIERLLKANEDGKLSITTPLIGEPVVLGKPLPASDWWRMVDVKTVTPLP